MKMIFGVRCNSSFGGESPLLRHFPNTVYALSKVTRLNL